MRRQKYKSLITITTRKNNGTYEHKVDIKDNDDYMKKMGINTYDISNLLPIIDPIKEDHAVYIEAINRRRTATTKISIETKVK